ncbi:MAG: TolB-like 6-bladed beta-propeller domain-containing protein [Prevotellaceae bacterium]|nr:TolB-like 6-bladed beta-propeller domain-containing protein [Prevotellaceae bacterium]
MNVKVVFSMLFAVILFDGCNNKTEIGIKQIPKPAFEKKISLFPDSVAVDVAVGIYGWKLANDQIIILSVQDRDHFLYAFSVPDFKLLYKYGQYGQGPDEFIAVNWLNTTKENQLGLYDIPRWNMYLYNLESDTLYRYETFKFSQWEGSLCKPYTFIQQLNDFVFLLKADMKEYTEIEVVDINSGTVLQTFRNLITREPNTIYTTYYFGMAASEKNLVLAYKYMNRLELFEYDTAMTPRLIIGSDRDQHDRKQWEDYVTYYTQVLCDDKYIYGLYQGGRKENEIRNSYIEIYTFDGAPVLQIELDRYIYSIQPDRKRNCIYGYSPDNSFDFAYIYPFDFPDAGK